MFKSALQQQEGWTLGGRPSGWGGQAALGASVLSDILDCLVNIPCVAADPMWREQAGSPCPCVESKPLLTLLPWGKLFWLSTVGPCVQGSNRRALSPPRRFSGEQLRAGLHGDKKQSHTFILKLILDLQSDQKPVCPLAHKKQCWEQLSLVPLNGGSGAMPRSPTPHPLGPGCRYTWTGGGDSIGEGLAEGDPQQSGAVMLYLCSKLRWVGLAVLQGPRQAGS